LIKFSIITVVKNRISTIDHAIKSILAQDYKNYEIIVIDGNSTDGTTKRLQSYKEKIKVLVTEHDLGVYHAMNKGLSYATGDVICFLNSDDFYANDKVFSNIANLFFVTKSDIIYGDIVYITQYKPHKIIRYWQSYLVSKRSFLLGHHPPHPAFFAKKKLYNNFGNFNTNLDIIADFDLMLRMFNSCKSKSYLKEICVVMRLGGISNKSFKSIMSQNIELIKITKNYDKKYPVILFLLIKPLLRIYQFFSAIIFKQRILKAITINNNKN
jgi:glycosyltransferase involved in cell wall biosynthesis